MPQTDNPVTGFRPFFNPATGEWITYTAIAADNGGQLVRFNWRSVPGGVITEHIHPHQEERFTILAGEAHFTLDGEQRIAGAGETIIVPAGVPHSEGNLGPGEIEGVVELRPALLTKEFHEALAGLVADGKTTPRGAPKNPLQLGATFWHFRHRSRISSPPITVQNLMLPPLWALAKLFGIRPYYDRWDSRTWSSRLKPPRAWCRSQAKNKGDERMSSPANETTGTSHPSSVHPVPETSYLSRPEGRIGYDVAGDGALVVLVPGMGDLRAGYRFLAPALRAAGYRVACTDLRGHGDSDTTFASYGDQETAGDVIALITELGGAAVVVGNSMGAGAAVLAAAQQPGLVRALVLTGPFVRNPKTSALQRLLLRVAMAPPWAALSWKSYLPKLYAGRRPADFGEYRNQVVASLRRPGYAKAFSATTRTSHAPAEARLADVTASTLVVMGEQDPNFLTRRAEADWIARALRAEVVMVPDAGHYPQSQQPGITTAAVLRFLEPINGRA